MNLLDLDDNWFLYRAFDAERRTRLLRWLLMWRALCAMGTPGSFFGALGVTVAIRTDLRDEPWMIVPAVVLMFVGSLFLIILGSLDGYIKTLKVVARLQHQTDFAPPTSNSVRTGA